MVPLAQVISRRVGRDIVDKALYDIMFKGDDYSTVAKRYGISSPGTVWYWEYVERTKGTSESLRAYAQEMRKAHEEVNAETEDTLRKAIEQLEKAVDAIAECHCLLTLLVKGR